MDLRGISHILYTQDDCQTGLSQFSSYYYRVVSGLLDAEKVGATTVAPLMPFVPCNDAAIEADPTTPAQSTVLTRYSVDCRTFLDLSAAVVCDIDTFLEKADGKFHHSWAPDGTVFWLDKEKRTINTIESDGAVRMVVDSTAPCAITAMPPAWGVGKPIMTVLSATNKYKFRLGTQPAWPHPGYTNGPRPCRRVDQLSYFRQSQGKSAESCRRHLHCHGLDLGPGPCQGRLHNPQGMDEDSRIYDAPSYYYQSRRPLALRLGRSLGRFTRLRLVSRTILRGGL
jgi:hypothetical protein